MKKEKKKIKSSVCFYLFVEGLVSELKNGTRQTDRFIVNKFFRERHSVRNKVVGCYNRLNSNHFTEKNLREYIYDLLIRSDRTEKNIWFDIKQENIDKFTKISTKHLTRDESFIRLLLSKQNIDLKSLFKIGDSGICPALILLEKKHISVMTYLEKSENLSGFEKSHKEQKRINDTIKIIKTEEERWQ